MTETLAEDKEVLISHIVDGFKVSEELLKSEQRPNLSIVPAELAVSHEEEAYISTDITQLSQYLD